MKTINIRTAEPLGDKEPEPTTIIIGGRPPDFENLEVARGWYALQGQKLFAALRNSLPGGTIDQLLIELLEHKASLYRGIR